MNEINTQKKNSSFASLWLVATVVVGLLAGCASTPDGLDPAQIAEATERADERSETLAELVPAETKVLVQIQYDGLKEAYHRLSDERLPPADFDEELSALLDHIDIERPVVVAVATTESEEFIEHAWLHGMATGLQDLATGVHLRVVLPAVDTAKLDDGLAPLCGDDDPYWICRPKKHSEHVSVDFLFQAPESVQRAFLDELDSEDEASNPGLFERRTPALHAFLNADAPVAAYWSGHHVLDARLVDGSALIHTEWSMFSGERSMAGHMDVLLWNHGHLLTSLRADPKTAEFEDFAMTADIVELGTSAEKGDDSSQADIGFQLDVVRTYTERGLKVWQQSEENADGETESSVLDTAVQQAVIPRWAAQDAQALVYWFDELSTRRIHLVEWLYPMLESPGGLVKSARSDAEVLQWFEERFSDVEFEVNPTESEALWRMRVDGGALANSPLRRLEQHLGAEEGRLQASSYPHDTYEVTRLRLAPRDASWQAPPPVAFDADAFDSIEPGESWLGCVGPERSELSDAFSALEMSVPEARGKIMMELGQTGIERCSKEYPERSEQFQRALGSWNGWKGLRNSTFYNFHDARRYAEAGCERGFELSCAHKEGLETIDDFSMPPFGHDWNLGRTLPSEEAGVYTFLVSDRGLFDESDLVVDADALDDNAEDAVAPLVDKLDGDAVQLVPDAMADASLVATAADAFVEHGVDTGIVAMSGGAFSGTAMLETKASQDGDPPAFGLHLTANGVIFFDLDGAVPPIEGCPAGGPTFCVTPEGQPAPQLFERAQQKWSDGDVEEAAEIIDAVLDRYQLHEIYNLVDHHLHATPTTALHVSVDDDLPAVAAVRLLAALAHERQGAPFEEGDHFRRAHFEFDREQRQPRPMFEHIRLRAERVSTPEDGDGMGRLSEDSAPDASAMSAMGIARPAPKSWDDDSVSDRPDDLDPELETDEPTTQGGLDRDLIVRVVRQNQRDIRHCYESRLYDDPELEGALTVQWVIAPNGDVVTANIEESTLDDEKLHRCIARRIQRWRFPEPDGGGIVEVNYPFGFSH